MTLRETTIQKILEKKVIAIIRNFDWETCVKAAEALQAGGIELVEVTFNQSNSESFINTQKAIAQINECFPGMLAGAGTVLTREQVDMAADAGAKYIISPDFNPDIIRHTREKGLVSIPGALTPSEITGAHRAGADFVKLFPAGELGTGYIKAIRAPISHIRLLAVGGVNEENMAEFLKAGVCGIGAGGNLLNKKWIAEGAYNRITDLARKYAEQANI